MALTRKIINEIPLFVVFLALYPSLALLSTNIREVDALSVLRPLVISIVLVGLLAILLFRIFKDWKKASLFTAIIVGLFFIYGHVVRLLTQLVGSKYKISIEIFVYVVAVVIVFLAARQIKKSTKGAGQWISILNISTLVLVIFPIVQIFTAMRQTKEGIKPTPAQQTVTSGNATNFEYPDIYYIILDGYSRADTLKELGYDNSEFLNSLRQDGFFIASCSRSNYRATLLSMSSIFNMDYIWNVLPNSGGNDSNSAPVYDILVHNKVREELKKRGYTIISFETGYRWDEWKDADLYLSPKANTVMDYLDSRSMTPFEYIFLRNTAVVPFLENSNFATTRFYPQYNRINYVLDELPKLITRPGPKFIYAHIVSPHYPFIFLPDGSLNTDSRYYDTEEDAPSNPELFTTGYLNNVKFLNQRVPEVIHAILAKSKTPPVIVIQGDHGFVISKRRYNNLNALYLPNNGNSILYPEITSVNTFRVVFNSIFHTKLPLLQDDSIDTDIGYPYRRRVHKPFPEACPK